MRTDDLIDRLGRDVTVTRPLPPPGIRTAMWMVWAVIYLVVVAVMMFAVMSSAGVTPTPRYLVQQSAALVTGIMAARAALASVIPGANDRVWVLPAIGVATWAAALLWAGVLDLQASGTLGVTSQSDWPCVASMTVGGLLVGFPLVWMLRRGAPLTPHLTAFLAALAALRELAEPVIGMRTNASAASFHAVLRPLVSLPISSSVGPVRSKSNTSTAPCSSVPTTTIGMPWDRRTSTHSITS